MEKSGNHFDLHLSFNSENSFSIFRKKMGLKLIILPLELVAVIGSSPSSV